MYTCGLTVVIKRICHVMLCYVMQWQDLEVQLEVSVCRVVWARRLLALIEAVGQLRVRTDVLLCTHTPTHTVTRRDSTTSQVVHRQPDQGLYKSSATNFQKISRRYPGYILRKNSRRLSRDKPYNIRMQVQFVMSINEYVMMSSDQRNANPWDDSDPVHPRTTVQYSALK